mmetsp:Transcript_49613/g.107464  ORF Transcript_49613/g.107464 Transcript_49613/m.107464 type:complete len:249 (+) Transcript_49613:1102-1848(+)
MRLQQSLGALLVGSRAHWKSDAGGGWPRAICLANHEMCQAAAMTSMPLTMMQMTKMRTASCVERKSGSLPMKKRKKTTNASTSSSMLAGNVSIKGHHSTNATTSCRGKGPGGALPDDHQSMLTNQRVLDQMEAQSAPHAIRGQQQQQARPSSAQRDLRAGHGRVQVCGLRGMKRASKVQTRQQQPARTVRAIMIEMKSSSIRECVSGSIVRSSTGSCCTQLGGPDDSSSPRQGEFEEALGSFLLHTMA